MKGTDRINKFRNLASQTQLNSLYVTGMQCVSKSYNPEARNLIVGELVCATISLGANN